MSELLEARYGRAKSRNRDRKLAFGIGGTVAVLFTAWMIAVVFFAPPKASGQITGLEAVSNSEAIVKGIITKPIDQTAICGIGARNGTLGIVGFVEQSFSAESVSVPFEVKLRTTELAGSGVVTECRLK
ncbi:MAG: DUF4307 domain-containing protein [Micrococcales bacterium]